MHYRLVRSLEAKLRELLHHPEFERLNDKHFKKFYKDGVIELAALEDGAWHEDDDARGDEGDDLPRNVPPPPALMGHSVLDHKAIDFRDIKISLDFWSHQSGNRRAYVNCDRPADHRRHGGAALREVRVLEGLRDGGEVLRMALVLGEGILPF